MYKTIYGLCERPFQPIPSARHYFPARAPEEARETLERVVQRGEGPAVLIGPAGVGKTMICRVLTETFRQRYATIGIEGGALDRKRELYQTLLHELHVAYRGLADGELRLAVIEALGRPESATEGVLLVVDEAHLLRMRLIEELRLLTNLGDHGRPRVRLILAGDGYLEERLAQPRLESLQQRLAARCYLRNLDRDEVGPYLAAQVQRAGAALEQLFDASAVSAIATATDGNPRLVNQLADHALVCKSLRQLCAEPLTASEIESAWADLQQLPAPWNADSQPEAETGGVIEFGPLDDSAFAEDEILRQAMLDHVTDQPLESGGDARSATVDTAEAEDAPAAIGLADTESYRESNPDVVDDEPVIVELPSREEFPLPDEQSTSKAVDEPDSVEPYDDPFDDDFAEETAVPLIADRAPTDETPQAAPDTKTPAGIPTWDSTTQIVAAGAGWLPLETLWVTPGSIPDLPEDDRDLIDVSSDEEPPEEAPAIPRPHAVRLLGSPEQLANIRK